MTIQDVENKLQANIAVDIYNGNERAAGKVSAAAIAIQGGLESYLTQLFNGQMPDKIAVELFKKNGSSYKHNGKPIVINNSPEEKPEETEEAEETTSENTQPEAEPTAPKNNNVMYDKTWYLEEKLRDTETKLSEFKAENRDLKSKNEKYKDKNWELKRALEKAEDQLGEKSMVREIASVVKEDPGILAGVVSALRPQQAPSLNGTENLSPAKTTVINFVKGVTDDDANGFANFIATLKSNPEFAAEYAELINKYQQ